MPAARSVALLLVPLAVLALGQGLASGQAAGGMATRVYLPAVLRIAGPGVTPAPTTFVAQVVALTNAERAKAGCPALVVEPRLAAAAAAHSRAMAQQDFFSHTGVDGSTPADRVSATGYAWRLVAENIAAGPPTPEAVVAGWMGSPGHRASILDCRLRETGVGYVYEPDDRRTVRLDDGRIGGPFFHYWTQLFATPRP